jgi:hypothetical protein
VGCFIRADSPALINRKILHEKRSENHRISVFKAR